MFQGRLRQADKLQGPAVPNILKGQGPAVPTWINGAGPIVQRAGGAKHFVQGPAVPIWINGQAGDAKLIVKGAGAGGARLALSSRAGCAVPKG